MGTWGVGPFDSDSAGDLIASLMKPIERVVKAKTDRTAQDYYEAARAAAQVIMLAAGTDILGGPSLYTVLDALKRIHTDKEWLRRFRDPRPIYRRTAKEVGECQALIDRLNKRQSARTRVLRRAKRRTR